MDGASEPRDPRRRLLLAALSAGVFAAVPSATQAFFHKRRSPDPLPPGRSFHKLAGSVRVNGAAAGLDTVVRAGDSVVTAAESSAVFAIGKDAFLLRSQSRLETGGDGFLVEQLRLLTGALLSVFGSRRHTLETPIAGVGIRGTGLYVETDPERTYACTCYGTTEIFALDDPAARETVVSDHHDAPRYILAAGAGGARIRPAPVINHTDQELTLIEALVGRVPPFAGRPNVNRYDG